jgi:hypothetical protein
MVAALPEIIPSPFGVAFAPICALMGKLAEKPGEYRQGRAGNWRQLALFRGSRPPFRRARSRRPWIASRQVASLYSHGPRLRAVACGPANRHSSAICQFSVVRPRFVDPVGVERGIHPQDAKTAKKGKRTRQLCAPARRRVAREVRAVCSSDAARWRIGRKEGQRPMGRSVAELPPGPAPGKRNRGDCGLSLVSGCSSPGVKARSWIDGYQPWLLEHRLASPGQRQPIHAVSSYSIESNVTHDLGTCRLFDEKTQAISAASVAWSDCRRCAAVGHDSGSASSSD